VILSARGRFDLRRAFCGGFGSGLLRVYAPQLGHGRDSIASRAYTDQSPASGHP
jgi:hypothetical protein